MNFKGRNGNITKALYIILVLCVTSIMFLSVYSMFNQNQNQSQNQSGIGGSGGSALNNVPDNGDSEDAIFDFFKKSTAEAVPTESAAAKPEEKPAEPPAIIPVTEPELVREDATDRTADIAADPVENAIEVISVPAVYSKPVPGYVSRKHDPENHEYSVAMNDYRTHMGVDIDSEVGVNVKAVSAGIIAGIYDDPLMGKTVVIEHPDNITSIYMNLQELLPKDIAVGVEVKGGDVVGGVGETALIEAFDIPHLHFEMKKDGSYTDPLEYIKY